MQGEESAIWPLMDAVQEEYNRPLPDCRLVVEAAIGYARTPMEMTW